MFPERIEHKDEVFSLKKRHMCTHTKVKLHTISRQGVFNRVGDRGKNFFLQADYLKAYEYVASTTP